MGRHAPYFDFGHKEHEDELHHCPAQRPFYIRATRQCEAVCSTGIIPTDYNRRLQACCAAPNQMFSEVDYMCHDCTNDYNPVTDLAAPMRPRGSWLDLPSVKPAHPVHDTILPQ